MKALISPNEQREAGYRVADVHPDGFDIAEPLFWVDCADDVVQDQFWYDPADQSIKSIPIPEPVVVLPNSQSTVDGAETL